MARALTSIELAHLRSERQRSRLYLAIHKPVAVYSCRVNQAVFTDPVVEVTYDGASGTLADVLADMTVWVGTTAGARDVGITRVRKAPSASLLYVPPGEIAWENDLYLTVVDEFRLWPRVPQAVYNDVWMDWDVVYSDQHSACNPVPVLGPHAVAWLVDGTTEISFDASDSWVPGSTISAYTWSAPGSASIDDDTSATPLITYTAAGTYRVSCLITAANGKTSTGYRRVFVFDAEHPPVSEFSLRSCRGDYDGGGWSFSVEMYDQCALTDLVEGALVVLFAQDWYGDDPISIGPVPGRENVITWGWIENESLTIDSESGQARFNAQGPAWWMQQCHTAALNLSKVDETPTRWTEIEDLIIDHWVWHLITWRSTAAGIMDVLPSGDTRYSAGFEAESGSLWDKVREVCRNRMATIVPACDRYGRLIVEADAQLLPVANRTAVPVVHALADGDWRDQVEIERRTLPTTSQVEVCGVGSDTVTSYDQLWYARALSKYEQALGSILVLDRIVATSQEDVNEICGLLYGKANNPYPLVVLRLAANHRMVDVCPRQYLTLSILSAQNPRGITWSSARLVVRRVTFAYDQENGVLLTDVECEGEALPGAGITYYPPPEPTSNENPEPGTETNFSWNFPPWPNPPSYIPPEIPPGASCPTSAPANGPFDMWIRGILHDTDPFSKYGNLRCRIRGTGADHPSKYQINGKFYTRPGIGSGDFTWVETLLDDFYTVYGLDANNNRVATGVKDAVVSPGHVRLGTFSPAATVEIRRIEVAMDAPYQFAYYNYDSVGAFDQCTALSTTKFIRITNGGVYVYVLWQLRGNAIPAGWYVSGNPTGGKIGYRNMTARYFSARRKVDYGIYPAHTTGFNGAYCSGNGVAKIAGAAYTVDANNCHDLSGTFLLDGAGGTTNEFSMSEYFRINTPTPGSTFDFFIKYEMWLTPIESSKIEFDNLFLWNICPPEA